MNKIEAISEDENIKGEKVDLKPYIDSGYISPHNKTEEFTELGLKPLLKGLCAPDVGRIIESVRGLGGKIDTYVCEYDQNSYNRAWLPVNNGQDEAII